LEEVAAAAVVAAAAAAEGEIQVWGEVVVEAGPPLAVVALLAWILILGDQLEDPHHVQVVEALEPP
jgi:hypothetical protein